MAKAKCGYISRNASGKGIVMGLGEDRKKSTKQGAASEVERDNVKNTALELAKQGPVEPGDVVRELSATEKSMPTSSATLRGIVRRMREKGDVVGSPRKCRGNNALPVT